MPRRIKDLVRQLMPVTPLTGELTKTDLAVLEHWADPRALLAAGRSRLLAVGGFGDPGQQPGPTGGQQGAARTDAWRAAAQAAVDLYGEHPAVALQRPGRRGGHRGPVASSRAELTGHAEARADAYRWTDPARLAASLPGLGKVGAPTVTAIVGRAARFRTGKGVPLLHRAGAPGQQPGPTGGQQGSGVGPVLEHHQVGLGQLPGQRGNRHQLTHQVLDLSLIHISEPTRPY